MTPVRIGQRVTHVQDDAPCPRVGTIIALVRRCPDRVIVCWAPDHEHGPTEIADWTVEHVDHLAPRAPAVPA